MSWVGYAEGLQEQVQQLVRDLCAIPAPSNFEERRAEFCKKWFQDNGFQDVTIDAALNVLAPVNITTDNPIVVVMAHTDTVFPDMEPLPFVEKDGYMYSPGVTDDTANLAVTMVCAKVFREQAKLGNTGVLFVANSGEEGLGNLKGCREIVRQYGHRMTEFVTLDSDRMDKIYVQTVGSHRYKITVKTEGGHSFNKFGNRNAIHVLSSMIATLYTVKVPVEGDSRTTYNVGSISGGTSVNTIAQNAEMLFEYRSNNRQCLEKMRQMLENVIAAYRSTGVEIDVEVIGERPCAGDIDQARFDDLKNRVKASMNRVIKPAEILETSASTDCNIPAAQGIPAVGFGVCRGAGCHTRSEMLEVASLLDGTRLLLDFLQSSYSQNNA